jgi:hypothetical protein
MTWKGDEAARRKWKKRRGIENERGIKAIRYSSNYRILCISYLRSSFNRQVYVEFSTNIRFIPYSS